MATNKDSLNLQAELLLRLVGQRAGGAGTAEAGAAAVNSFLQRAGVASDGWQIRDGSGLSRSDLVTASGLVDLLVAMDRHPQAAVFRASLPVAGVDGTLETRLRGTPAVRRVTAKTGTLGLAQALVGYATTACGERLAFAVIVNNARRPREAITAIDAAVQAIVSP